MEKKINDRTGHNRLVRPYGTKRFAISGLLALSSLFVTDAKIHAAQIQKKDGSGSIFVKDDNEAASRKNVPTFRNFLTLRRQALQQLDKIQNDRLQPVVLKAQTTAEQRAGVRRIRIRGFQIVSDSNTDFAGYNLGPSSPESALAVLASDLADTYVSQAALKGIPIDSLSVHVTSRPNLTPNTKNVPYPRNLLYTAYIVSPASDTQLAELRKDVEKNSPIFNLLSKAQTINGKIDYTQTPEELFIPEGGQPGLREYLKYKRIAYLHLREEAEKAKASGKTADNAISAYVTVEGGTGVRRIHIRQFEILHDNPAYLAGNDLGPSALEHQVGVLTSCITHIFLIQAAARQVTLDSLQVSAQGTYDVRAGKPGFENVPIYPHNLTYTVHVKSPASYDEIKSLRDAVEAVCPIYNLLKDEQQIEGKIVRGSYKGA